MYNHSLKLILQNFKKNIFDIVKQKYVYVKLDFSKKEILNFTSHKIYGCFDSSIYVI